MSSTDNLTRPSLGILSQLAQAQSRQRRAEAVEDSQDPRSVTRGSFFPKALTPKEKTNPDHVRRSAKQPPSKKGSRDDDALAGMLSEFSFDWFQFTIPTDEGGGSCRPGDASEREALRRAIAWATTNGLHEGRIIGGANGYRVRLPLHAGPEGEVIAAISSGSSSGIMPNITITGGEGACQGLAEAAQEAFSMMRLSRADAALDVSLGGLWDALHDMAVMLSKANPKMGNVRVIDGGQGRTFYLGSRSSAVSLRVYEKDLERVSRGRLDEEAADPDLVRVEWTFRPQSRSKKGMAKLSPGDMIRTSVWARDFTARMARLTGVTEGMAKAKPQRVEREERSSSLESSASHGAMQYGQVFARLAIAQIVKRSGKTYAEAQICPVSIESVAAEIFREHIRGAGEKAAIRERVTMEDTREVRTARIVREMLDAAITVTESKAAAAGVVSDVQLMLHGEDDEGGAATAAIAAKLAEDAAQERTRSRS